MIFGAGPNIFTHFIMNLKKKNPLDLISCPNGCHPFVIYGSTG